MTGVVMAGTSYAAALYLQLVLGMSPLQVGAWLVPQNLVLLVGTLVAPRLEVRFGSLRLVCCGLGVAGGGLALLGALDADALLLHLMAMVLAAGGVSVVMALVMNLIMAAAPRERAGSAASLAETCGELGIALGVATLGSLVTVVYRLTLPGHLPAQTPHRTAELAAEGISAAPSAVAHSPELAAPIIDAARVAFTQGYNVIGVLGGVAMIVLAIVAGRVLGRTPSAAARSTSTLPEPATR